MSLVVENGTGLSNAESYISEAESLTYQASRGNTTWNTITSGQREEALRRATDYMLQAYRASWQGVRGSSTQALDWPRYDVVVDGYYLASNIIPQAVKNACAELALRAAAGELYSDQSQGVISKQVGPIKVEYDKSSPISVRYKSIDSILLPYLKGLGGVNVRMIIQ